MPPAKKSAPVKTWDEVVLPHSEEAEMCLLGCGMMGCGMRFPQEVPDSWFYLPANKAIYRAIIGCAIRGVEPDLLTVKDWLITHGKMKEAGGLDYVINTHEAVPSIHNYVHYKTVARDYWALRMLEFRGRDLLQVIKDPSKELAFKLDYAATMTAGIFVEDSGALTASDVDLTPREMGASIGLGYGLDSVTGGCHGGQVNVCQAKRKGGKTTGMVQMALSELQNGGAVIFVPIADMTASDIARKMIRQMCGWDRPPSQPSFQDAYYQTVDQFRAFGDRLCIWDPNLSSGTSDIESITSWLDAQIHRRRPTKVFLDYFQRLTTRDSKEFSAATYAAIAQKLGKWAHRYPDIATWVGSQETEDGRAAWTRELENETALSVRLVKPEGSETRRICSVDLNRFGPMGGTVAFEFDQKYLAFREDKT